MYQNVVLEVVHYQEFKDVATRPTTVMDVEFYSVLSTKLLNQMGSQLRIAVMPARTSTMKAIVKSFELTCLYKIYYILMNYQIIKKSIKV